MRWRCENTQVNVLNWTNLTKMEHVGACWSMLDHVGTWTRTNLTMLELLAPCSSHRGRLSTPLICTLLPFCLFPGWGWLHQNRIGLLYNRQNHFFLHINIWRSHHHSWQSYPKAFGIVPESDHFVTNLRWDCLPLTVRKVASSTGKRWYWGQSWEKNKKRWGYGGWESRPGRVGRPWRSCCLVKKEEKDENVGERMESDIQRHRLLHFGKCRFQSAVMKLFTLLHGENACFSFTLQAQQHAGWIPNLIQGPLVLFSKTSQILFNKGRTRSRSRGSESRGNLVPGADFHNDTITTNWCTYAGWESA